MFPDDASPTEITTLLGQVCSEFRRDHRGTHPDAVFPEIKCKNRKAKGQPVSDSASNRIESSKSSESSAAEVRRDLVSNSNNEASNQSTSTTRTNSPWPYHNSDQLPNSNQPHQSSNSNQLHQLSNSNQPHQSSISMPQYPITPYAMCPTASAYPIHPPSATPYQMHPHYVYPSQQAANPPIHSIESRLTIPNQQFSHQGDNQNQKRFPVGLNARGDENDESGDEEVNGYYTEE